MSHGDSSPQTGSDWTGGYATSVAYRASAHTGLSPEYLDLVCLLRRRRPPRRTDSFRLADLGCGAGFTLNGLAAAYPEAQFHGVDFMPEHIVRATDLANEAGLANAGFDDAAFADLTGRDPPGGRFDYVLLHGVWTWVSDEVRAQLIDVLDRWVAPGGVVYVGYNAMPHWAEFAGLRRIVQGLIGPGTPGPRQASIARKAVQAWFDLGRAPAGALALWEHIRDLPDSYLVHELGVAHGEARWSADVAAELSAARLEPVGSLNLAENIDELVMTDAELEFVRDARAFGLGSVARDLVGHTPFRPAVYARGAPGLTDAQHLDLFSQVIVEASEPVLKFEKRAAEEVSGRTLAPEIRDPLVAALADGARPVGDVLPLTGFEPARALQAVMLGLADATLRPVRSGPPVDAAAEAVRRFNGAVLARRNMGENLPGFASARLGMVATLATEEFDASTSPSGAPDLAAALARDGFLTPAAPATD